MTDEVVYLVNWTDLTSSLQFENTKIPDKINGNLKIKIENGFYKVIVKQLFDHNNYDDWENRVSYVVEFMSESKNPDITVEKIIWTEDFPDDGTYFITDEPNEFDYFLDQIIEKDNIDVENKLIDFQKMSYDISLYRIETKEKEEATDDDNFFEKKD